MHFPRPEFSTILNYDDVFNGQIFEISALHYHYVLMDQPIGVLIRPSCEALFEIPSFVALSS
jgi:hypothetical protein